VARRGKNNDEIGPPPCIISGFVGVLSMADPRRQRTILRPIQSRFGSPRRTAGYDVWWPEHFGQKTQRNVGPDGSSSRTRVAPANVTARHTSVARAVPGPVHSCWCRGRPSSSIGDSIQGFTNWTYDEKTDLSDHRPCSASPRYGKPSRSVRNARRDRARQAEAWRAHLRHAGVGLRAAHEHRALLENQVGH